MTATNSTTPVGATTTANSSSSSSGSSSSGIAGLTMNDFLTLMTAQLQNQDPLNPADSNEFLSQLSELSTVQGISQMNTTMTALSTSLISSQALASASLVGQSVLTPATSAAYTSGSTLSGAVRQQRDDLDHQRRRRADRSDSCVRDLRSAELHLERHDQ